MQSKEYYRDYYWKNRARILKRKKEYGKENRDKIQARNRRYWKERRYAERNREFMRQRYRENKAVLDRIKEESGCMLCDEDDPVCLEFHHRDPEQRVAQVSALCGYSWKKMMDEVARCDVLCANCHAKQHYHERHLPTWMRKRRVRQRELPFGEPA